MLFYHAKVSLKVFSILFSVLWGYCVRTFEQHKSEKHVQSCFTKSSTTDYLDCDFLISVPCSSSLAIFERKTPQAIERAVGNLYQRKPNLHSFYYCSTDNVVKKCCFHQAQRLKRSLTLQATRLDARFT